ncbi:MAG: cytidylate kinase-like family protein [Syntrophales bacterium]|nr:cytidylate kinase-like family protein [Syntrophales bacterium]
MERIHSAARSLEKIVEEQVKRWQVEQKKKYKKPIRPVITMSRLPGAGAQNIAKLLVEDLKIDFFDSEIVEMIAKNAQVSEKIVRTLDEQDRSIFDEWIHALSERHLWSDEYFDQLTRVVNSIGTHGYALIMGRGASFILPKEVCLRVLVVAPLSVRIENVMRKYNVSEAEARREVLRTEANRRAFIRKYFNAEMTEPTNYDLVVNTENLQLDAAVKVIKEAYNSRQWYNYNLRK